MIGTITIENNVQTTGKFCDKIQTSMNNTCQKDLQLKMSYYPPSENGAKVNMIKQKFEQNLLPKEKVIDLQGRRDIEDDQKESLRRSLSASPVKSKKNFNLNVSRQLSNPGGKNIKRTPAIRGDKLSRTKNLRSPAKERFVSIVNRNVKIFEESQEYGKIGNVKKKSDSTALGERLERGPSDAEEIGGLATLSGNGINKKAEGDPIDLPTSQCHRISNWKESKPVVPKSTRITDDNMVRTTMISRQKNILGNHNRDGELANSMPNRTAAEGSSNSQDYIELKKLVKNGAEYAKVMKRNSRPSIIDDKMGRLSCGKVNENFKTNVTASGVSDIKEELSRRIYRGTESNNETNFEVESSDITVDGETTERFVTTRKIYRAADEYSGNKSLASEKVVGVELISDRLKAALQAPLPAGPPPKKPPRTFLHSPAKDIASLKEESEYRRRRPTTESIVREEEKPNSKPTRSSGNEKIEGSKGIGDSSRDSKKMLEKLEHVLIKHQKALGAKVMMPRKGKHDDVVSPISGTGETKAKASCFNNIGLSRTLEDSKKLDSLAKVPAESKPRKHSTFDCLPSFNCASRTSIYEQVKNPDFKSYFTATSSSSLWESKSSISKSEDSLESSVSNALLSGNAEFSDEPAASKRLSTELSTFLDRKKCQISGNESEERVYAEPFAFDENSGTDITGYGIHTSEEYNYFSRSLQDETFGNSNNDKSLLAQKRNFCSRWLSRSDDTSLSVANPALHYMCTSIQRRVYKDTNNDCATSKTIVQQGEERSLPKKNLLLMKTDDCYPPRAELDKFNNKIKVEQLPNEAFGKLAMADSETPIDSNTSSDTDSLVSSFSINDKIFEMNRNNYEKPTKDELHRSLTEKRKNYVRRVSSKYSESRDEAGDSFVNSRRNKLFQVCLLVELNLSTREPYIKYKYPGYAKTPAWIENFCFPDATNWPPSDSNQNQFYTLVLMDERGNRSYGYCCRVRPEDGPILPLAYCLITKFRASGFYRKVLLELESRHGLPDISRISFIKELYKCPMPKPGQSLRMTAHENERASSGCSTTDDNKLRSKNVILSKSIDSNNFDKLYSIEVCQKPESPHLTLPLLINEGTISEKKLNALVDSDSTESIIIRSDDPRLEERNMSQLFDAVSNKVLIILFGSLLLERRVVLLCDKLSKLSSCVDALQSLLYPFTWPHTFIPVLPDIPGLSEILQAPLPFVIGILKSKNSINTDVASIRDGIVVDLDTSKIICAVGDESSILPSRWQKGIRSALQLVYSHTKSGDGIRNFLVSEAFLRHLVENCSHCDSHLVTQQDGKVIFQKESFIEASSKNVQYFLEWFVETTMFNTFIQDCVARTKGLTNHESPDFNLFHQRAAEFRRRAEKSTESKNSCLKKKTLGDRLKDLTNFHT